MIGLFSVFTLDFLALECLSEGGAEAYYSTTYLWCFIPMILAFGVVAVGAIRWLFVVESSATNRSDGLMKSRERITSQHVWLLLFLSYLILPPVTNKQLQVFDCIELDSKERYLRTNTTIDCKSSDYLSFKYVIIILLCIYQCIPLCWFTLLYQQRASLNPDTSSHDEKLALYIRDNHAELRPLKFLFVDYKCSKWWFEIADMYRRIAFIGVLPLVSPRSEIKSSFGCILAILSVAYFREEKPYRVRFTNFIAHIAQV
jgi:hypothetical protein